jgi:hypothetical protein
MIYLHGYSSNRSREMIEPYLAAERGFFAISPDMRGRGTANPVHPYNEWPPTPFPRLLLDAELGIYFETFQPPPEFIFAFGMEDIKNTIAEKAIGLFEERIQRGELRVFQDTYNYSAGKADDGGVEIHDIFDSLIYCNRKYPGLLDLDYAHAVGVSGGGGSVFSLVTKFPDLLNTAASFFGIADYEYWYRFCNTTNRPGLQKTMSRNIGGSPDDVPNRYLARNSILGAGNCEHTNIHLYWDETEIQCPGYFNLEFERQTRLSGLVNVHLHETTSADAGRALHVYPFGGPSRKCFEKYLEIAESAASRRVSRETGNYIILGYLRTKDFFIMFNDGTDCVTDLEVRQNNHGLEFLLKPRTGHGYNYGIFVPLGLYAGFELFEENNQCAHKHYGLLDGFEIASTGRYGLLPPREEQ